jgi:PAS domain S-box-containing protein
MSKESGSGKNRMFADLVALHQSITTAESSGSKSSAAATPDAPGADPESLADNRYQLFCERFPMGVMLADVGRDRYRHAETFRPVNVNMEYARLIGLARVTILESEFFDVLPGGRTDWRDSLNDVAAKGRPIRGTAYWDATDTHLQITLFLPRRDLLAVVIEDASLRTSTSTSISQHESQLDSIMRTTTELVCRFRPDGTLTYANRAYCEFFKNVREELVGHCFLDEVPDDEKDDVRSRLSMLNRDHPMVTYQHRFSSEEVDRWVEWTDVAVFDGEGEITEYQSFGRDVTEPRRAAAETTRLAGFMEDLLHHRTQQCSVAESQVNEKHITSEVLSTEVESLRAEIERLRGLTINGNLNVCSSCQRINDDEGHWMVVPLYLEGHTAASVNSKVCPYCRSKAERALERNRHSR